MSVRPDRSNATAIVAGCQGGVARSSERWSTLLGAVLIAVSAASFGAMAIFARIAYGSGANVSGVLWVRFSLAGFFLAAVLLGTGRSFPRGRQLAVAAAMGGIGYVGQAVAYFSALQYASAGLVALLLSLYPALVCLLAALFLGDKLTGRKALLLGVSFAGTVLTIGAGSGTPRGVLLGITAALIYSIYIAVGSRFLAGSDAVATSAVVCLSAAAVLTVITRFSAPRFPSDSSGWVALVAIALVSTVIAVFTFLAGLQRLGASRAAILSTLEPVVTLALAATFLGEGLLPLQLIGGAMILLAAALVAR